MSDALLDAEPVVLDDLDFEPTCTWTACDRPQEWLWRTSCSSRCYEVVGLVCREHDDCAREGLPELIASNVCAECHLSLVLVEHRSL